LAGVPSSENSGNVIIGFAYFFKFIGEKFDRLRPVRH
jgi:hypothetical protein